ncbi:MAG: hypothetical protein ACI9CF_000654 [Candidatus Omnitrophota bacterium]|jgi:hypothetical protein
MAAKGDEYTMTHPQKNFGEMALEIARWDLGYISQYLDLVGSKLEENKAEFSEWYKENLKQLPDREMKYYKEFHGDEFYERHHVQPFLLHSMLLVSCMSLLENKLAEVCQEIRNLNNIELTLGDITGLGIQRARVYLKKVIGVEFPDQDSTWHEITMYQKIRNYIIHQNSTLDDSESSNAIRDYAHKRGKQFRVHKDNTIWFSGEFCSEAIENIGTFFKTLYPAAYAKVI